MDEGVRVTEAAEDGANGGFVGRAGVEEGVEEGGEGGG